MRKQFSSVAINVSNFTDLPKPKLNISNSTYNQNTYQSLDFDFNIYKTMYKNTLRINGIYRDINKDALLMQKDELQEKFSSDIIALDVDVSSEKDLTKARNEIMKHYGQINGLVNNAANNPKIEASKEENFSRIENFPLEIWEKDLSVGLTGAFLCAKFFF